MTKKFKINNFVATYNMVS